MSGAPKLPNSEDFQMKNRVWMALLLAAALSLPVLAQQNSTTSDQSQPSAQEPAATQNTQTPSAQQPAMQTDKSAEQGANPPSATQGAHQPLVVDKKQGFWGKLNPFARKKYVQRQLSPIRDRVNELDDLTAQNAKDIKDVDSRAQQGIQLASNKANEADQHAIDAGNRAQAAQQTANTATTHINTVEQVVSNIDQYKPTTQTEIRFRPGQSVLSKRAKEALDQMATPLQNQRGYIIEVQGFSSGRGQGAIQNSQKMAESVVRYLVLNHDIPVYRIYLLGMGNAPVATEGGRAKRVIGGRVEVSLMKNDLEQLSSVTGTQGSQTAPATPQQPQQQ